MVRKAKTVWASRLLTAVIIAALAMAAGLWSAKLLLRNEPDLTGLDATRFPSPRQIPAFNLIDHNNKPFTDASLHGNWSFLFFGYTHCPDVCPTTLSVLNSVAQRFQDTADNIRFIFISVDPERDTPESLARFVAYFNGEFIGVTGSNAALEQFTRELGIMYLKVQPGDDATGYLMDHTASVLLFDPDGRYHAVFSPPLSAETITSDFRRMLQAYREAQ